MAVSGSLVRRLGRHSALRSLGVRFGSDSAAAYSYGTLNVTVPSPFVYSVEMNRPKKMNALNKEMWTEIGDVFTKLSVDPECRVVVVSAAGRMFSSGKVSGVFPYS